MSLAMNWTLNWTGPGVRCGAVRVRTPIWTGPWHPYACVLCIIDCLRGSSVCMGGALCLREVGAFWGNAFWGGAFWDCIRGFP
jgi:hypothetical protein